LIKYAFSQNQEQFSQFWHILPENTKKVVYLWAII